MTGNQRSGWPRGEFAVLCVFTALSGLALSDGVVRHQPSLWIGGGLGSVGVAVLIIWPLLRRGRR